MSSLRIFLNASAILLVIILNIKCTSSTNSTSLVDDRIVGGVQQLIRYRKFQVAVTLGPYLCGGSLITMRWVVSAAHCVYKMSAKDTTVRAGSNYFNRGGYVRKAKRLIRRHDFNPSNLDHDISVILLRSPFYRNSLVGGIYMADHLPANGAPVKVSGYGTTSSGGSLAPYLKSVWLDVIPFTECNKDYGGALTLRMFCAGVPAGGKDSCQGDSGGPLTHNGALVGVVSFGNGCATKRYPGVYTRVPYYKKWIRKVMKYHH